MLDVEFDSGGNGGLLLINPSCGKGEEKMVEYSTEPALFLIRTCFHGKGI